MRVVAVPETAGPPAVVEPEAGAELVLDLRDHVVAGNGPIVTHRRRQASASPSARTRRSLVVVVAAAVAVAALLAAWPEDAARERSTGTAPPAPTAPETTAPSIPAPAVVDAPAPAAPATTAAPAAPTAPATSTSVPAAPVRSAPPAAPVVTPAPPVVVERSTSSIELFLAEDAGASSATMTVGPSVGTDPVRLELLADVPAEGTTVPVQVRITNDRDGALDFPGDITVTVIGERDGLPVARAVLQLPGVTRIAGRSSQLLAGEIVLTHGTTTLRAELPVEEPAAGS